MRYLIYARVSPKGSSWEGTETSIPDQIEECRRYIVARDPQAEIETIQDEFYTAANDKRPGYQQVLHELKTGTARWDALVVRHLDRLSRSLVDSIPVIRQLKEHAKGLVSVLQNLDLSNPTGRAMLYIILVFAQWEREMLGERVKAKMVSIAESGGWPPGNPPFGYMRGDKHDNVLKVEPRKAGIVRDIFSRYAGGESGDSIARSYRGQAPGLTKNNILWMLRNRVYLGRICYDDKEYAGRHEPLVTQGLFDQVQTKLPNRRRASRPNAQQYPYLLTGILRCKCGRFLTAHTAWNRSRQYPYYRCTDTACKQQVPARELEELVVEVLRNAPVDEAMILATLEEVQRLREQRLAQAHPELAEAKRALAQVEAELAKVHQAFLSGLVTVENKDYWNDHLLRLRQERDRLGKRKEELGSIVSAGLGPYESAAAMAKALKHYSDAIAAVGEDPETKRHAVLALVERIDQLPDGRFKLTLAGGVHKDLGWLPRLDSNQDKQDQNLLCYRYTTGQQAERQTRRECR